MKLLGGGVPVPATPSQKIALASGLQPHTNHNPWGTPAERFPGARRQDVPLGPDQDVEAGARVRQQQAGGVLPVQRPEQGTIRIELHPEEQLGVGR